LKEIELHGGITPFGKRERTLDLLFPLQPVKPTAASDEVTGAFEDDPHFFEVVERELGIPPRGDDFIRPFRADPWDA
jgi:hypothetical protein